MNARVKLVVTALFLCLALALTIFCAVQTVQAFQRFQQQRQLVVTRDVRAIRPWMTVPYIAHFYHVPENYLDQSLHITNDPTAHLLPLRDLAPRIKRPLDGLIHDIQQAILNYRKHPVISRTRAVASPAPAQYTPLEQLRSMVGAGLATALVQSSETTLVRASAITDTGEETRL